MKPNYVVVAASLVYKGDSKIVPAYYHEAAKELAASTGKDRNHGFLSTGNLEAVITETIEDAVALLAADIGRMIKNWWGGNYAFKESDFKFTILFSEVKEGRYWVVPYGSYCMEYPVKF